MNRIKELAQQAGLIAPHGSDREGLRDFDYRKFADLIIQDCLQKIELEAAQYAEPVWSVELVNDIKEHFEVQE